MEPIVPFWFKQRQCKAEPAGEDVLRVSGPNLGDAYLLIRPAENNRWQAALRTTPDGHDVVATDGDIVSQQDAWDAAFELYRNQIIV
jgi:hypothetical protein